jgi:hypothetical protein
MVEIKRQVELLWKYNPTSFEKINKDVLGEQFRIIGSGVQAVAKILSHGDMLKFLMPEILGISPDTRDINWDQQVKLYWDSIAVKINSGGKKLETGFVFDIDDYKRKELIANISKAKSIKTSEDLADYVMGFEGDKPNVPEEAKWKYGHPISVEDYLLWRYILNYKRVANNPAEVNKSPNIAFFLHTSEERERVRKQDALVKKNAITAYMEFMKELNVDNINDALSILTPSSIKEIVENKDVEDKQAKLLEFATSDPNTFIKVVKDKHLQTRATIERLLSYRVIKQLSNSTIIVESADPSVILGNNMDEAISYMGNEKNKAKINELTAKYKSLTSK